MNESLKIAFCEKQAELFVLAKEKGHDSESFIKPFMKSDTTKNLDKPFHHMQWAGAHYLLPRMEEDCADALIQGESYDTETFYWAGYLYRYWHIYTSESSREIYKQIPAKTMRIVYLMYHTMAIDRLKESYQEKHKK